jgi:glycosyltransferase involved in cell wall biosynthesis/CDP-glycerol glycerophosphotransferase (TagB/SpsB family)
VDLSDHVGPPSAKGRHRLSNGSISLVVPTYNVGRFLPDFFSSLDEQAGGIDDIEIVFVDDGSTDDSAARIEKWISSGHHTNARVVSKPNGGLASARNRGLEEITGDWVSFPDPDDRFAPNYFATIRRFLNSSKAKSVHLVAANLLILDDATGEVLNRHPLRFKFAEGERIHDLARFPKNIHLQAASAFYRRELIQKFGLTFDHRIRPNFEDAALTTLYLARFDRPRLAVLPDAGYHYRRRADGSSLVQGSWRKPEKYTDLLEYGHLALLRAITELRGSVPLWAQNLVLYDLAFYFRNDNRPNSPTGGIGPEVSARFHELLPQILSYIDLAAIEGFRIVWLGAEMRAALAIAKGIDPLSRGVEMDRLDEPRRLVRVRYYFTGDAPKEQFYARGYAVEPVFSKIRSVRFLGKTMMYQRIAWLPANGTLAVELDGEAVPILLGREAEERFSVGPTALWTMLAEREPPPDLYRRPRPPGLRPLLGAWKRTVLSTVRPKRPLSIMKRDLKDRIIMRRARLPIARVRYRNAWLLIDRDTQAQDNAEHLYRYLRKHQPHLNIWYVLSRTSSDWDRLQRDGFRLLEHRSRQHTFALRNCRHVISSQIDHYVVHPLPTSRFGPETWHYTFLQHGVTKDDLSVWINSKPIDLMITVTPDETASIVGDGTPYVFTDREVRMTGFPRHDRLLELARAVPPDDRKLILIMPTWRRELLLESVSGGNERRLRDDFWQTEYATQWRRVIESPALHELTRQRGWQICFIPHPNMQGYLDNSPLPPHISVHAFKDIDIQQMLAKAGALVTDYSSMGFEMAYLERPVVYFQFDRDEFFSGVHAYRRGTWSYDDDGFGPVCLDAERVITEVGAIIDRSGAPAAPYAGRMAATFPLRDGKCCERTHEAIRDIDRELSYDELYLRTESPEELAGVPVAEELAKLNPG